VVGDVSCLSAGHNRDMQKRLNRSNAVWSMDSGGTKKPSVGCKARVPQGKGAFRGHSSRPIVNYMEYPACGLRSIILTEFGKWQQRCGLSLSVLQQLVVVACVGVCDCGLQDRNPRRCIGRLSAASNWAPTSSSTCPAPTIP